MWVDSTVGEGSMFCFQISLNKAQHSPHSGQPIRLAELEGRTALLIDDNRVALSITTRTLTEWGMQVVSFHSVTEALGYLAKADEKPEVALIDMMRPDLEAPEAMRQFTSHPSLAGINLIVLTSEASPGSARLCQNIGFKGYLPKPVPRGAIRDVLCTVLGVENSKEPKAIITRHSAREELFKNKRILLLDTNPDTETESLKLLSQLGTSVTPVYAPFASHGFARVTVGVCHVSVEMRFLASSSATAAAIPSGLSSGTRDCRRVHFVPP